MNVNREKLQKAMNIVNTNKNNPLIKQYYDALHIVLEAYDDSHKDKKGNFFAFDDKYNYYIIEPREIISLENGNYVFKKVGYDAYACNKETGKPSLHFRRSLCNYNLEQIQKVILNHIIERTNNE